MFNTNTQRKTVVPVPYLRRTDAAQPPQQRDNRNSANEGRSIYTDAELLDKKVPFAYVATAVNFTVNNMYRGDAMVDAFNQYASAWMDQQDLTGILLTHNDINRLADELIAYLRSKVQVASVTKADMVAGAVAGAYSHARV